MSSLMIYTVYILCCRFQLFINGKVYTDEFPSSQKSILLSGLHGDKTYELCLEVYSKQDNFLPLKSNRTVS